MICTRSQIISLEERASRINEKISENAGKLSGEALAVIKGTLGSSINSARQGYVDFAEAQINHLRVYSGIAPYIV